MCPLTDKCIKVTHFFSKGKFWYKNNYKWFNSIVLSFTCHLSSLQTKLVIWQITVLVYWRGRKWNIIKASLLIIFLNIWDYRRRKKIVIFLLDIYARNLETTAVNTEGFSLLVVTYTITRGWNLEIWSKYSVWLADQ